MATYTPNIDLKKPAQSDKIRIADLNGNADNIDAALGADFGVSNKPSVDDAVNSLGAGLAIISNGDIHAAITAGQYVYVRGHGTLTEGLYVATANVSQNVALTGSNVDAVSGGGLNALNSNLANFCKPVYNSFTAQATHDISCPVAGKYLVIARANSSTLSNTAILAITSSGKPTARAIGAAGGNCVCTWCDDVAQNAIISLSSSNMSTDDGYFHVFAILLQPA